MALNPLRTLIVLIHGHQLQIMGHWPHRWELIPLIVFIWSSWKLFLTFLEIGNIKTGQRSQVLSLLKWFRTFKFISLKLFSKKNIHLFIGILEILNNICNSLELSNLSAVKGFTLSEIPGGHKISHSLAVFPKNSGFSPIETFLVDNKKSKIAWNLFWCPWSSLRINSELGLRLNLNMEYHRTVLVICWFPCLLFDLLSWHRHDLFLFKIYYSGNETKTLKNTKEISIFIDVKHTNT